MPYSGADDAKLPKNVKGLPAKQRRQWVSVWNNAFARCNREGGKDCDAAAFKLANGVVFKMEDNLVIDGLSINLNDLVGALKQQVNRDRLRQQQQARSKKYGIAALREGGGALTIPARFARMGAKEADFGDPVNFKYLIWLSKSPDSISAAQLGQVRNALPRFEQNKDAYDTRSRAAVESRIDQARKKFKVGEFAETEKADIEWQCEIAKLDEERQIVYGVALRASVPDSQGDLISPEEIEQTAHDFLINSRKGDLQHRERLARAEFQVVESHIARIAEPPHISRGDWVVAVKLGDRLWGMVKRREINGFSIKGKGRRMLVA